MSRTGTFFQKGGLTFRHYVTEKPIPAAYSMHIHRELELIYILSGEVYRVIEGRKYRLTAGDMVVIRPTQYHFGQMVSSDRYERYNILIDLNQFPLESLNLIPDNVEIMKLSDNPIAKDLFQKMDYYHQHTSGDTFLRICSLLLNELFYNLSFAPRPAPDDSSIISSVISQALKYISENLFTLTDVREISDALYVSESYLFRLFRKYLHQSPKKYILEKRLLAAQRYISRGGKPSEAYKKCGFHDYSVFYRNYTAFFGYSPSQEPPDPQPLDLPEKDTRNFTEIP